MRMIKLFFLFLSIVIVMNSCEELKSMASTSNYHPPATLGDVKIGMSRSSFNYKHSISGVLLGEEKGNGEEVCSIYRYEIESKYYILTFCNGELTKWWKDEAL